MASNAKYIHPNQTFMQTNYTSERNEFFFKVIVIGNERAGKTCIVDRFAIDPYEYKQDYKPTIGCDFRCKEFIVDENTVALQLWDTGLVFVYNKYIKII